MSKASLAVEPAFHGTFLIAAGGTGGHLFPAEALAGVLVSRRHNVALVSDKRALAFADRFPGEEVHVLTSGTVTGGGILGKIMGALRLVKGTREALSLLSKVKPAAVIGFGGYPTVPPIYAATMRGIPTLIHEANAVMGRANRFLAPRVSAIATGFELADDTFDAKTSVTGNPVRGTVIAAAGQAYDPPRADGKFRILVTGGSQGARVMSDVVPSAIVALPDDLRARIVLVQQARPEDVHLVKAQYLHHSIEAEVQSFFSDLPARMAASHLVIGRAGASTVTELSVIGRPAILVPLPGALDKDQAANAAKFVEAGAGVMQSQPQFTPAWLSHELAEMMKAPERLATSAAAAKSLARPHAAESLADLVERLAGVPKRG